VDNIYGVYYIQSEQPKTCHKSSRKTRDSIDHWQCPEAVAGSFVSDTTPWSCSIPEVDGPCNSCRICAQDETPMYRLAAKVIQGISVMAQSCLQHQIGEQYACAASASKPLFLFGCPIIHSLESAKNIGSKGRTFLSSSFAKIL
jgi:hypothetical protein